MPKKILTGALIVLLALVLFSGPAAVPGPIQTLPEVILKEATFKQVVLDPPPLEAGGHILVSAGDFLPLAGGSADWYKNRGILRGSKGTAVVAGSLAAEVDGVPRRLDAAPVLVDDKLYIPLSLALEVLGLPASGRMGAAPEQESTDTYLPPLKGRAGLHFRYYPVYDLQARYDPARGQLTGELLLAYQNPYLVPLRKLYFNLPANALYGNGAQLTVSRVYINKRPVPFNSRGSSLEVFLPLSLAPRETLSLALSFTTQVPEEAARLGRTGDTLMAAGWYPLLAPHTGDTWAGVAGTPYGDPYFAAAAYYRVRLTMPSGYRVLASSRETGRQEGGDWTVWTFNSEHPIREFAFTAAPDWQLASRQVGAVQMVIASRGEPAAAALEVAGQALDFFQAAYGLYPYSYLHLAFVPLDNLAGMEYPGFIILSNRKSYSPATVVHEIAHQWWYNLVGNDSLHAAWIDEGLAEYSTLLFYRQGDQALYQAKLAEIGRLAGQTAQPINLSLEEYGNEQAYRLAVYNRGATFWLELEAAAGTARLQQALAYVQRYYRYEIVPPQAMVTILTYYGRLAATNFTPYLRN
ncbi:Peptidase M1, membrane alanine aminopeptidase,N-terminal [Moorella glycerini]|uniref:Aminopeptidase N n=1 Tax=Neomoorella stamsii TaxID=1266720 RepID=A0A9X7P5Y1_9FIRM|nr:MULTISPECIES: M1 family aminopeptidase [Moorella]PRR72340.1 Aminopeptidase N [Moorella stamsii]CEP68849.1 Peptidase M1, membrane alanine aminopeptidase,N-terminal [Moorella glycerini]